MRLLEQPQKLNIRNYDWLLQQQSNAPLRHSPLLPNTIRCVIVGPSNCGKTSVMLNLLEDKNGLRFENVYLFSKSLYQPMYRYLKEILDPIKGINYYEFKDSDEILSPNEAKSNSIMIFDDVSCEPQSVIREYFSMGRHNKIDSFFLSQSYSKISKQLIRDNVNFLIVFKQDETNLKHVYHDHVNTDFDYDKFIKLCRFCWNNEKYGFLVISKDNDINRGRYRKGFDHFIDINNI